MAYSRPLVPINTHTFELPQQSRTTWDLPFADNGLTSADHSSPGDASHHYWGRHSDSPLTPGFSPHLAAPTGSVHSASDARSSFTSFAPSKSDSGWPVPSRSMSFGLVEDISHFGYPNPYHPQHLSMDLRRRASDMHPPSSQSSANSSNTSISEAHMTPLLGPLSSSPSLNWGVATSWAALPSSSLVTKAPDYWYSEPAPLAKVQEEDIGPHSSGEPTILYSDREHR